jgi:hypothetical protein
MKNIAMKILHYQKKLYRKQFLTMNRTHKQIVHISFLKQKFRLLFAKNTQFSIKLLQITLTSLLNQIQKMILIIKMDKNVKLYLSSMLISKN